MHSILLPDAKTRPDQRTPTWRERAGLQGSHYIIQFLVWVHLVGHSQSFKHHPDIGRPISLTAKLLKCLPMTRSLFTLLCEHYINRLCAKSRNKTSPLLSVYSLFGSPAPAEAHFSLFMLVNGALGNIVAARTAINEDKYIVCRILTKYFYL